MRLQPPVQFVEHETWLDGAALVFDVERKRSGQMFRTIDDEAMIDRLAALRGAAASSGDADPLGHGDGDSRLRLVDRGGDGDDGRHHLVVGRVRRIAAAGECIGQNAADASSLKALSKRRRGLLRHANFFPIKFVN